MKVLVIPDVHLKPWMFDTATQILKTHKEIEKAICLGDLVDDFEQSSNLDLYEKTLYRVIDFIQEFPNTLMCYGNHDVSYLWEKHETGFSELAIPVVQLLMNKLKTQLGDNLTFIHKIDNVLFSHAGVCQEFVDMYVPIRFSKFNADKTIQWINELPNNILWTDVSPIWARPQFCDYIAGFDANLWKPRKFLQVVGHTPTEKVNQDKNLISCDVFSTYRDGTPYGERKFTIIDTEKKSFEVI